MNKWKELNYKKLPNDIMSDSYEFQQFINGVWSGVDLGGPYACPQFDVVDDLIFGVRARYRKKHN